LADRISIVSRFREPLGVPRYGRENSGDGVPEYGVLRMAVQKS